MDNDILLTLINETLCANHIFASMADNVRSIYAQLLAATCNKMSRILDINLNRPQIISLVTHFSTVFTEPLPPNYSELTGDKIEDIVEGVFEDIIPGGDCDDGLLEDIASKLSENIWYVFTTDPGMPEPVDDPNPGPVVIPEPRGAAPTGPNNSTEAEARKRNEALIRAETLVLKYTQPNRSGIEQKDEAMDIISAIIHNRPDCKIQNESTRAAYRQLLMANNVRDNTRAVLGILCKYTHLGSYVTESTPKDSENPLNASHMRRVRDATSVEGGILMPPSTSVDMSNVLWDHAVIAEFGNAIPVLNVQSEEMQILLSKEAGFVERTIAVNRIKHQLNQANVSKVKVFEALKTFTVQPKIGATLAPIIVAATEEFMSTTSGDLKVPALALSTRNPSKAKYLDERNCLDLNFISHFYNTLSPASGANIYIAKSKLVAEKLGLEPYDSLESFKSDIESRGYPRFFILTPKRISFKKAKGESLTSMLLGLAGSGIHLVEASIASHQCILVLNDMFAKALFNI